MAEKENEQQKQQNKLKELKQDYLKVFSTESGKRVLANLESVCFINKTTYSERQGAIYFNEGMRFVVVHIKNMINFDLKKLEELTREGE